MSMYSDVVRDLLAEERTSEMPSISLPFSSSTIVLNLLKVLTEGMVFSTDPESLREVGIAAQILGISLEGMELGSRKMPHNKMPSRTAKKEINKKQSSNEVSDINEKSE